MDFAINADAAAIVADLDRQGFAVVEHAIARAAADAVRKVLWDTAEALERRGVSTHSAIIDRNAANVRVYDLPDHDPVFLDLLMWTTEPSSIGCSCPPSTVRTAPKPRSTLSDRCTSPGSTRPFDRDRWGATGMSKRSFEVGCRTGPPTESP